MKSLTPVDLVIFDCDGVLVDSCRAEEECIRKVVADSGIELDDQFPSGAFRGLRLGTVASRIEVAYGVELPSTFLRDLRDRLAVEVDGSCVEMTGAAACLTSICERFCVASSSPRGVIEDRLDSASLLDLVPSGAIFSAYDIESWKPDPGLFLHAAEIMAVPASGCLVVEDSMVGVEAGLRAGMRVVAVGPREHLLAASSWEVQFLDGLPELRQFLEGVSDRKG